MKIKIPIRLKITIISKNYYLKIPVRVYVRACVRVRMIVRTPPDTRPAHQRNTRAEKGGLMQSGKPVYIGRLPTMKKSIKKVKKNLELRKNVVTLHQKQTTNKFNNKQTKQ